VAGVYDVYRAGPGENGAGQNGGDRPGAGVRPSSPGMSVETEAFSQESLVESSSADNQA
jgi:hypothetical protein